MDSFTEQAVNMVLSPEVREAFDLSKESEKTRDAYGRTGFGQSLLLSRRLVEAGSRFVTAAGHDLNAWDTHANNDKSHRDKLVPGLERSLPVLLDDLEERGNGPLHQVPQSLKLVSFGGVVPSLPDGVVNELYQRARAISWNGGLWPRLKPGDRVRVALGPLDSLAEVVEGAESPGARVRVLMEFLGRMVEARVPLGSVQQAGVVRNAVQQDRRPSRRTRGRRRWINGFGPRSIRESSDLPDDSNKGQPSS